MKAGKKSDKSSKIVALQLDTKQTPTQKTLQTKINTMSSNSRTSSVNVSRSDTDDDDSSTYYSNTTDVIYGASGFVHMDDEKKIVSKHMKFSYLYFLPELAVFIGTSHEEEPSILKPLTYGFGDVFHPKTNDSDVYFNMTFPKLSSDLFEWESDDELDVLQILFDTLSGLSVLHRNNIIHRDIKPENVLVQFKDPDTKNIDHAYLIDFSHSVRLVPGITYQTDVVSDEYKAPEIWAFYNSVQKSKDTKTSDIDIPLIPYGTSSDVWSLGLLAFELFTKTPDAYTTYIKVLNMIADTPKLLPEHVFYKTDYLKTMKIIFMKSVSYKHATKYWSWIECMLTDQTNRITADALLKDVYNYTKANDLKINYDFMPKPKKETPPHILITPCNNKPLLEAALEVTKEVYKDMSTLQDKYHFAQYDRTYYRNICSYLINNKCLTKLNISYVLHALYFMVNIIRYDNVVVFDQKTFPGDEETFHGTKKELITLTELYKRTLFVYRVDPKCNY